MNVKLYCGAILYFTLMIMTIAIPKYSGNAFGGYLGNKRTSLKPIFHCNAKYLAMPPTPEFCVGDTNMLVYFGVT